MVCSSECSCCDYYCYFICAIGLYVAQKQYIMYYPVGWPKVLLASDVEDGKPVQILQHPRKELLLVVREKCMSLWHTRVSEAPVCV